MFNRDLKGTVVVENDEAYAKSYYARIYNNLKLQDNLFSLVIGPTKGMWQEIRDIRTANGDMDCEIYERPANTMAIKQTIVVFVKMYDGNKLDISDLGIIGPLDFKAYVSVVNTLTPTRISTDRFFSIDSERGATIVDSNNKNTFEIDFYPYVFCYGPHQFMFFDGDESYDFDFVIYDETTGKVRHKIPDEPGAYLPEDSRYLVFTKDDWDYQVIAGNDDSGNLLKYKVPVRDTLISDISKIAGGSGMLRLEFDNRKMNLLSPDGELIFGFNGQNAWVEGGICMMRYEESDNPKYKQKTRKNSWDYEPEYAICRLRDGSYEKWSLEERDSPHEKCDKYGRTEKDRIGDRNLQAWLAAGGHSPEAKAQMDAMWADRRGNEDSDGSEAMKAWDDNDRGLDKRTPGVWGDKPFDFNNVMDGMWDLSDFKDKKDDPNWGGYADLIDPTWAQRDETSPERKRGYFYRIGKQGQPLDQPWYSEDEVPANLSDRPVPHGKIYENYKSLISLMDRMGLLED